MTYREMLKALQGLTDEQLDAHAVALDIPQSDVYPIETYIVRELVVDDPIHGVALVIED